jgi:hydrogenase maturation protease
MAELTPRILVAGIGNIFHGDDGFGPEVVRRLASEQLPEQVRVVDYGIRGMHLAYDLLDEYDALVLIDALPAGEKPGAVVVLEVTADDLPQDADLDAHDMNPVAALVSLRHLGGTLPPTYVVGARPAVLDEGIGLSPELEAAVPEAVRTVLELIGEHVRHDAVAAGGS